MTHPTRDRSLTAHPWHGVSPGEACPECVLCYIELVPTDAVKYELHKETGLLKLDRPQLFSNVCPSPYGFIPRTFCAEELGRRCEERTGRSGLRGDGDPLDICVLTEKPINHGGILLDAIPIGGLRMIDKGEVDDKIIAVLKGDAVYGSLRDIFDLRTAQRERLQHYFLTYKQLPGSSARLVEISEVYGQEEAHEVIRACLKDYQTHYPAT
jgi:inorganic pyrophosphatase